MGFLDMTAEIGDLGWEAIGASDSHLMILTCPECATSYFVDEARIAAGGRTVKCSHCGARWMAVPEGAQDSPAPAPGSAPAPAPQAPKPVAAPVAMVDELVVEGPLTSVVRQGSLQTAAPAREANLKVLVWVGSAVVAALLIAAAIVFRVQIVRLAPASQAAYAGLGMPVSSLVIEKIHADAAFQGGRPVLSVTGQLRNLRNAPANAPALRVSLLDRFGKSVATKVARPIDAAVPARAIRYFAISMVDPPASGHDLEVTFEAAPAGSGAKAAAPKPAAAPAGPQPIDARPLPLGSPDALPPR